MGCFARLGCLVMLALLAVGGWLTRDRWLHRITGNDRARLQLGGSFRVIRPGLSEFEVREIKLRDFNVPRGAIPRLVQQISRGNHPEGVAPNALAVTTPRSLADVRIANGRVTLYKTTGT